MFRHFAISSIAVVGLLTMAVAPADAGAKTGTWTYWNPSLAQAAPPYSPYWHEQHGGGYAGRSYGHRGYQDHRGGTPDTRDGLMGTPTATTITHPAGDSKTWSGRLSTDQERDLDTDGVPLGGGPTKPSARHNAPASAAPTEPNPRRSHRLRNAGARGYPPTGGRGPHEAVQTGFDNRPESHLAPAIHPRQTFRDSL